MVKGALLQRQLCHQRLWVRAQALLLPAATGRSVGQRTIGQASSGFGRALPVGISLSHRAPATPVAGQAQCALTKVALVHGVSSDTLVRLASGLDARCVKKQCGLVGLCIRGLMTSSLPSPYGSCSDRTR